MIGELTRNTPLPARRVLCRYIRRMLPTILNPYEQIFDGPQRNFNIFFKCNSITLLVGVLGKIVMYTRFEYDWGGGGYRTDYFFRSICQIDPR